MNTPKADDSCTWERLPDATDNPFDLQRVQFRVGCNGATAKGVHAIYPDNCTVCGKPVRIAS